MCIVSLEVLFVRLTFRRRVESQLAPVIESGFAFKDPQQRGDPSFRCQIVDETAKEITVSSED